MDGLIKKQVIVPQTTEAGKCSRQTLDRIMTLKDELTLDSREKQIGWQSWGKRYLLWGRKDASGRENMQMVSGFVSIVVCWTEQLSVVQVTRIQKCC